MVSGNKVSHRSSGVCVSVFLVFLGLGTNAIGKDSANIPPPEAPLVANVPENADWTVTSKDSSQEKGKKGKSAGPAWLITEVRSTKAGPVRRDLVTSADGVTREVWFTENYRIWKTDQGEISVNDFGAASVPDPADPNPSVPAGFPGVAWVSLDNFSNIEDFNGEPCYHYVSEHNEAWISVKTKLPAGYKSGTTTYSYKFNAPPKEDLKMPPAYKDALEKVSQMRIQPS